MIARTAFNQLRHSWLLLGVAVTGLLVTYVAPVALLFSRAWIVAAIACLLMIKTYLPIVRLYRLNPAWSLTLPLAAIFYLSATVHSAIRYAMGSGGEWKGRAQDAKPVSATPSPRG
jgi:hypothetical protein